MTLCLETKKLKRTGYLIAFPAGGLLAAAFPLVNMLVRPEAFTSLPGSPLAVLLDANWQMMAMLNILVSICGACIMYHTEYADNGAQKMELLPVRTGRLFGWKFVLAALALASMVAIETAALAGCIKANAGENLESLTLFDVYTGEKVGEGKKSLAYNLVFRAADRTLTDQEVDEAIGRVLKALGEKGVSLRS